MSTLPTPRTDAWLKEPDQRTTTSALNLARQLERELAVANCQILQASTDFAALRSVADGLAEALEKINKDIPACDQNGQLYVLHFDGEGNELGQEFVDPVALCGHLFARSEQALARFRDAANPASARTPPGTNGRSGDEG